MREFENVPEGLDVAVTCLISKMYIQHDGMYGKDVLYCQLSFNLKSFTTKCVFKAVDYVGFY